MAGIGYPVSQPGDIVAAVFSAGDGAPPNAHWAILLFLECNNTSTLGAGHGNVTATAAVYHVREGSSRGWVFETVRCVPEIQLGGGSGSGSGRCKVLVKIGSIKTIAFQDGSYITPTQALLHPTHRSHLKTLLVPLLQQIPMRVPPEDWVVETRFDCRVWFRAAVRALRAIGLVRCERVGLLEEECKECYREAGRRERRGYASGGVVRAVSIHGR
ncbi:hypothetical protein R3P38DRAFT_3620923 [Favolaschia claudopus]|uniref:Uncharacterized protein n=1 Tax=Favolaschia claudopus TaxID=2862362 RepID=A0AAW0DFU2_9AGAR